MVRVPGGDAPTELLSTVATEGVGDIIGNSGIS